MYERVLIPLDGSEATEAILPFAEEIAGPADAEVVLLRVVEPVAPAGALADADPLESDGLALRYFEAKRYLTEVAERLAAKRLRVRTLLALGNAAPAILAQARAHGADLIAMSTHGRGGFGRVLFGSVAEEVLRTARIPVLLIRMTAEVAATAAAGNLARRRPGGPLRDRPHADLRAGLGAGLAARPAVSGSAAHHVVQAAPCAVLTVGPPGQSEGHQHAD